MLETSMAEMATGTADYLRLQRALETHLTLQRFEGDDVVQSIEMTSDVDGTIIFSSQGKLPRGLLRNLFRFRNNALKWDKAIKEDIVFVHEGHRIAFLHNRHPNKSRLSIRWWLILRYVARWI